MASRAALQLAPVLAPASMASITRKPSISPATAAPSSPPRLWRQVQATVRAGLQTATKDRVVAPEIPAVPITAPALTVVAVPSLVHQGVENSNSALLSGHGHPVSPNSDKAAGNEASMAKSSCFHGEAAAVCCHDSHQSTYFSNQAPTREARIKHSPQPEPSSGAGSTSPHEEHTAVKSHENCEIPLVSEFVLEAEKVVRCTDYDEEIPFIQQPGIVQGLSRFLGPEHSFPDLRSKECVSEVARKDEQNLPHNQRSKETLDSPVSSNEMDVKTLSTDSFDDEEDAKSFKMPPPPAHKSTLSRLHPFTASSPAPPYMAITRSSPSIQSSPDAASTVSWNKACPRPVEPNPAMNSAWDRPPSAEGPSASPYESDYIRSNAQTGFIARNIQDAFGRRHIQSLFSGSKFSSEGLAQNNFTRSNDQDLRNVQDAFGKTLMQNDFIRGNASSMNQAQGDFNMRNTQDGSPKCIMQDSHGNSGTPLGIHVQDRSNTSNLLSEKAGTENTFQMQVDITRSAAPRLSAVDTHQRKELSFSGLSMADINADKSSYSERAMSVCTENIAAAPFDITSVSSLTSTPVRPGTFTPWAVAKDTTCNKSSSDPLNAAASAAPTPSDVLVKSQISSGPAQIVVKCPESGDIAESPSSRPVQGRLVQCLHESAADRGKANLQECEAEDRKQGRQRTTSRAEKGRRSRSREDAQECGTPCSVSPDQDWGDSLHTCTPEKGALRHDSPIVSSGRNNESSEETNCSPFDFETHKETLNKLKVFSPVPISFTHRPMFEYLDKDADKNQENLRPGKGFSLPFMDSIFNEEGSPSTVLAESLPQEKWSSAPSSRFLLSDQEDGPKKPGDTDIFFNFASSPAGCEERGDFLDQATETGIQDQASYNGREDSSFLFNLGATNTSSSFSFNFSSPISSPSH